MTLEPWFRLMAGMFVLVSLLLSQAPSPYWLFFTPFVGPNLFQSSLIGWCPMEDILHKLAMKDQCA